MEEFPREDIDITKMTPAELVEFTFRTLPSEDKVWCGGCKRLNKSKASVAKLCGYCIVNSIPLTPNKTDKYFYQKDPNFILPKPSTPPPKLTDVPSTGIPKPVPERPVSEDISRSKVRVSKPRKSKKKSSKKQLPELPATKPELSKSTMKACDKCGLPVLKAKSKSTTCVGCLIKVDYNPTQSNVTKDETKVKKGWVW